MQKLQVGMAVEINPRSDRTRKVRVQGIVAEILTRAEQHPHGLLVKLEDGEIGRVKNIVTSSPSPRVAKDIDLQQLIKAGENQHMEFKAQALWSARYTADDIKKHRPQSSELHKFGQAASKIILAKAIAGFLNTEGGILVIGVKDDKEIETDNILGIELEYDKLKDPGEDGYRRMIVDLVKTYFPPEIFNHLSQYFHIRFETIDDHTICAIILTKSDRPAFLKLKDGDHFLIRVDASTREITGKEMVDYCKVHFHD